MPVTDTKAVVEAMRCDLGVGRVDDLELENGRGSCSIRPGQFDHIAAVAKPRVPPRALKPLADRWQAAIKKGEFDDDDAEAVKGLDRIGGGRLHALNKPPSNTPTFMGGRHPLKFDFKPPSRVQLTNKLPGAFPDSPSSNVSRENEPYRRADITGSPSVSKLGIVANGPVQRSQPSFQSDGPSINRRTISNQTNTALPSRNNGLRPIATQNPASMPPTSLQDEHHSVKEAVALNRLQNLSLNASVGEQNAQFRDPEPLEYFYKAEIRVADRHAKGPGVVYLLATSSDDTGIFSIYLQGLKYLEYPVLSMYNYIANSEEFCPQFRETDGSITTTSLVFGSQDRIVDFMKAVRSLQARNPTPSASKIPSNKTPKPAPDGGGPARVPSSSNAGKLSTKEAEKTLSKKSLDINAQARNVSTSNVVAGSSNDKAASTSSSITLSRDASAVHYEQPMPADNDNLLEDDSSSLLEQGSNILQVFHDLSAELVDLSQPAQAVPSSSLAGPSLVSSYAMDLGSLDFSMGTQASVSDGGRDANVDNAQLLVEEASSLEKGKKPCRPASSAAADEAKADPSDLTEKLKTCLSQILPTLEHLNKVVNSVSEGDREKISKAIAAGIEADNASDDDDDDDLSYRRVAAPRAPYIVAP
ncbi:hypothetical protein SPI_00916 [Niveomyces insectorum RCEF 264]|uniref:Uncharacterized protein n=1 Tax=Niveomyces insectorum RCEF 264 TaxID=1081102 RepID=A0A168AGT4_9HYPO|nr:hypothetical protein SPI_00916 [Niveomyces insectorum RCEF 264]